MKEAIGYVLVAVIVAGGTAAWLKTRKTKARLSEIEAAEKNSR